MIEVRAFGAAGLEVRGDGRTVVGRCVPWHEPAEIYSHGASYTEEFERGAIAQTSCQLTATHPETNAALPIGAGPVEDRDDGLWGSFRISQTSFGNDVLALVADHAVDGLSIGFLPVPGGDRWSADGSHVVRVRAILDHCAIVRRGAYSSAKILALRGGGLTPAQAAAEMDRKRFGPLTPAEAHELMLAKRAAPGEIDWPTAAAVLRRKYLSP